MNLVQNVKKIAVLRANALGDFIVILPALEALKNAYPDAELVLLGQPWHKKFLFQRDSPIDRVIIVPPMEGIWKGDTAASTEEKKNFFSSMKDEQFDIAVQLHGGGRYSNAFINSLGARITIGLKTPEAESLDRWIPYIYYQHEIIRYLEVVNLIGAAQTTIIPQLTVTQDDLQEAKAILPKNTQRFVTLHPGASDIRRLWPLEKFAEIGDFLIENNIQFLITGTQKEKDLIEKIIANMKHTPINLCGKLSLNGLAGLLSISLLVISNDTGPLHLAQAVGAKTIGIFWGPNLINWGPLFRENHRPVISWDLHCKKCGMNCAVGYPFEPKTKCQHDICFVDSIRAEEVLNHAKDLLNLE